MGRNVAQSCPFLCHSALSASISCGACRFQRFQRLSRLWNGLQCTWHTIRSCPNSHNHVHFTDLTLAARCWPIEGPSVLHWQCWRDNPLPSLNHVIWSVLHQAWADIPISQVYLTYKLTHHAFIWFSTSYVFGVLYYGIYYMSNMICVKLFATGYIINHIIEYFLIA